MIEPCHWDLRHIVNIVMGGKGGIAANKSSEVFEHFVLHLSGLTLFVTCFLLLLCSAGHGQRYASINIEPGGKGPTSYLELCPRPSAKDAMADSGFFIPSMDPFCDHLS